MQELKFQIKITVELHTSVKLDLKLLTYDKRQKYPILILMFF